MCLPCSALYRLIVAMLILLLLISLKVIYHWQCFCPLFCCANQVPGIARIDASDLDPSVVAMLNAVLLIFPEGIAPVHFSVALTRCRALPALMPTTWTPLWWRA